MKIKKAIKKAGLKQTRKRRLLQAVKKSAAPEPARLDADGHVGAMTQAAMEDVIRNARHLRFDSLKSVMGKYTKGVASDLPPLNADYCVGSRCFVCGDPNSHFRIHTDDFSFDHVSCVKHRIDLCNRADMQLGLATPTTSIRSTSTVQSRAAQEAPRPAPEPPPVATPRREIGRKFTGAMRWHRDGLQQLWAIEYYVTYQSGQCERAHTDIEDTWITVPTV
jgi:hypothetical protein